MAFRKADLAISTMWNYGKAGTGEELLDQLIALGFSRVELNYQVRPEWLPGIERYAREGRMAVSSVHNVFPKVGDARFGTDSVLLGYEDEALRRRAVELTKGTIDWACRLGAGAVVIHPTEVPLDPQRFDVPLKRLIAARRTDTEEYRMLRAEMLAARQAEPYLSRMAQSLEELAEYVTRQGLPVRLGVENRAMCHQIPLYGEFEQVAARFGGSPVGVWLDTGHGIMMEEIGLQALPLSQEVTACLVGMHIHDAADGLDHHAPCSLPGNVLDPFRSYIDAAPIRVLELSGRLSAEDIVTGTERFVARYGG